MKVTTYDDAPSDCIFLPIVEWSFIEMNLSDFKRADYDQKGYPTIELNDGRYKYLPVTIDGHEYRFIAGSRPVKKVDNA